MVLKYGYVAGEHADNMQTTTAQIIQPLKVPDTITLSVANSSKFLIIGTKPEILEWIRIHPNIKLDVTLFDAASDAPHIRIPDVVVDLLPCYDAEARPKHRFSSFLSSLNPLAHPDPSYEPVCLEFRALNAKLDDEITETYFRIVVERGNTFADIYGAIEYKWATVTYPSVWDNIKKVASAPVEALQTNEEF